ncbi:MAG: cupin 2 domain-containing protein [Rhodothermales bacterium]
MPNIFENIPADLPEELFELLGQGDGLRIERIVSKGHCSPASGWYEQAENEWVIVLRGEAELSYADGRTLRMTAGDFADIPAMQKHRVSWTAPDQETVWLALHYSADSASKSSTA